MNSGEHSGDDHRVVFGHALGAGDDRDPPARNPRSSPSQQAGGRSESRGGSGRPGPGPGKVPGQSAAGSVRPGSGFPERGARASRAQCFCAS
jgi:hypothetical protein